jgi:hydroxymethylpyrimidine pyrophosphatase-like HAD family hydrolase
MKYIVDIDGTICRTNGSEYVNSTPIKERIAVINRLYDEGHTVIYWTARGMASGTDHLELTSKQLVEWGCKFHELKMKKPSYDVWIDDKALSDREFFNDCSDR